MKKKIVALLAIATLAVGANYAYAANTAGGKCTKAGQTVTVGGQKLTCTLIWVAAGGSKKPAGDASKDSSGMSSKSFRLENATFNTDLGSAGATARITNTSKSTKSATMTITIFGPDGKSVKASLMGVANSVGAGQTVTVTFFSVNDQLPAGEFKYAFQVDTELNG